MTATETISAAVLNKPLRITIKAAQTKNTMDFVLKQPTMALLIEVSTILSGINVNDIRDLLDSKNVFPFVARYAGTVLTVIAIILSENIDYTQRIYDFCRDNLTPAELYDLLLNIVTRIGITDFTKSIIGVIPMSLYNQREIIARL